MKISIKCHDCKQRYVYEFKDDVFVQDYIINYERENPPLLCKFCYSDALFAEPVHWLDRHPCVKLAAHLLTLLFASAVVGFLMLEFIARCGG